MEDKLLASDGAAGDLFGYSVSISGNLALVGAPHDDDNGDDSGSVYAYNDSDIDGINDPIDLEPLTPSTLFSDTALGGATSGQILSLDPGITIEILDASDPAEGVRVIVYGPSGEVAKIRIDGSQGTYKLSPGQYILTFGSVIAETLEGELVVEFSIEGQTFVLSIGIGAEAVIHETIEEGKLQELNVQAVKGDVELDGEVVDPGGSATTKSVSIDIDPGNDPPCINNNGKGVIPVAIFSNEDFDATQVDPSTISLDGQMVRIKKHAQAYTEDVNDDGLEDLLVNIEDVDDTYQAGEVTATLTGETFDGKSIIGTDNICIIK
jgi:hypothetical protein